MTTYCPAGHKNTYSGMKPKKCATCGSDMETKKAAASTVSVPQFTTTPFTPVATGEDSRPLRMTIKANKLPPAMTVAEIRAGGAPIERAGDERGSVEGVEKVSAAEIVQNMIKGS